MTGGYKSCGIFWAQLYFQILLQYFDVLLTVHLSTFLVTDQLKAQILVL